VTAWIDALRAQADVAALRALSEQDGGPYSPTAGCFDRRFWAWKLVDFPESTFQRLVLPLALLFRDPRSRLHNRREVLAAVRAGLAFAARIQHANGSFDQAFPWEQSWGATAFLLYPLLEAARLVDEALGGDERRTIERMARRAAAFLCEHDERHGTISNHLAGGALALAVAATRLGDAQFQARADALAERVLAWQSPEGWCLEYDGADPGYQTLCLDYLSDLAERRPSAALDAALARAIAFLQWFAHPDGTFGGVYGSRRTSLVYLGGLARLAPRFPAAAALCDALGRAMARGDAAGPATVDTGNLAPMLTSVVHALSRPHDGPAAAARLPCHAPEARADFPEAGLHVRGGRRYYAICGASNGGTLTVFAGEPRRLAIDDGGWVAALPDGTLATTQATDRRRRTRVDGATIEIDAPFVRMSSMLPTPVRFLALRALSLTAMKNIAAGNWIKRRLVERFVERGAAVPLRLVRRIAFEDAGVRVHDRIENPSGLHLRWIAGGRPFSGIHMASAGYFQGARFGSAETGTELDAARLARDRAVEIERVIG
jgi:hypothetical protein